MNQHPLPSLLSTAWPGRHAWRRLVGLVTSATLLALGGCASVYLVDNQVQSFARWSETGTAASSSGIPQPPQVYRFERLPSQASGSAEDRQNALQALARGALEKVGWTLAEPGVAAPWSVQVSAIALRSPYAPWDDPWYGIWGGFGLPGRDYVVTGSGQVIWVPAFMPLESPYYQRKISLVIRRTSDGQVVYETHAAHDGRWGDAPDLWRAMLDAALRDFPAPPAGPRQVNIEVPR